MITELSIPYRAPNLVDMLILKQAEAVGYRIEAGPTVTGGFTELFTADIARGFVDKDATTGVDLRKINSWASNGRHVRAIFNPATFTGGAGIVDTAPFWITLTTVDAAAADIATTDPILVLTPSQRRGDLISLADTAPNEASIAASLKMCFGHKITEIIINNNDSVTLFVGFSEGGTETTVAAGESVRFGQIAPTDTVFVRGNGATADFSMSFTIFQR